MNEMEWLHKALASEISTAAEPIIAEAVKKFEAEAREKVLAFAIKTAKECCVITHRDRIQIDLTFGKEGGPWKRD